LQGEEFGIGGGKEEGTEIHRSRKKVLKNGHNYPTVQKRFGDFFPAERDMTSRKRSVVAIIWHRLRFPKSLS